MNEESKFTKVFCKQLITNTIKVIFLFYNNNYTFTAAPQGTYTYTLEVWGAEGGYGWDMTQGGKGGYAKGNVSLSASTPLYICVGGHGLPYPATSEPASGIVGGYNGGGLCPGSGPSGGGCTHIAKTTKRGVLKNYVNNKSEVLIVAGGGGGSERDMGGAGGGTTGGNGGTNYSTITKGATGGSQTAGGTYGTTSNQGDGTSGSFGQGGNGYGSTSTDAGGGGGGGWYGGGGITLAGGGGGGSGYIGGVTSGSMSNGQRIGHGYARITLTRW